MIKILEMIPQLSEEATISRFAEMVGKDKSAISGHRSSGVLKGTTMLDWLHSYMDHLSDMAGGRGTGSERLNEARIDDLESKASLNRLNYYERIGTLVPLELASTTLGEWAGYTSQEIKDGFEKLCIEIESKYSISIDDEVRNNVAGTTVERIKSYGLKLGQSLGASSEAETNTSKAFPVV